MKLLAASLEWLAGSVLRGSPLSRKTILGQSSQTFFWLVTRFLRAQVWQAFPNQRTPSPILSGTQVGGDRGARPLCLHADYASVWCLQTRNSMYITIDESDRRPIYRQVADE